MDLDGTLIDSDKTNFQLLSSLLKKYKYEDKINIIMKGLAEGVHFNEIMKEIEMPVEIRNMMDSEMKSLLRSQKYKLLPGVLENLEKLNQDGYIFSIVTDNYLEITINFLTQNQIMNYFNHQLIIGSNNFNYQKPSKKIVDEILKRSERKHGIIIGNSSKEIEFAKQSNLPIVILDNYSSNDLDITVQKYYQQSRQVAENETYKKIYKSLSWDEIHKVINNIIDSF